MKGFDSNAEGRGSPIPFRDVLPPELRKALERLSPKAGVEIVRKVILDLCTLGWWTPRELAEALGRKSPAHLSEHYLWPLVKRGMLERRHPDNPAHPQQAYRAAQYLERQRG